MDILEKMYNGIELTKLELSRLLHHSCKHNYNKHSKWGIDVESIIKYKDKVFILEWEHGLTELIDDEFLNQPYEVKEVKKIVEEITYEAIIGV